MTLKQLQDSLALAERRLRRYTLAAKRQKAIVKRRKKQIAALNTPEAKTVRWALGMVGTQEDPPNSNTSPVIGKWQRFFGDWLVRQPWCGTFAGYAVKTQGGVDKINSRVASVQFIENDAKQCINGFAGWITNPASAKRGDLVVLFGHGVHVEIVTSNDRTHSELHTVGGNTSPGTVGSQANGGGVYARKRAYKDVVGIARPRY